MQHRGHSQKVTDLVGTPWETMPKKTKLMEPRFPRRCITWAVVQKHGPYPGCKSRHALLGGRSGACRSRFERMWADTDSIEATAEAVKDVRQTSLSAATTVNPSAAHSAGGSFGKFEWTSTSDKLIIGFRDSGWSGDHCGSRTSSSTSVYAVSAMQDCIVGCS